MMQQAVHRAILAGRDGMVPFLNASAPAGGAGLLGATLPSGTTVTFTNTHFASFLVLMPWFTKFSNGAETQVVLASIPLLVLGFTGLAFTMFMLSIGRMNRSLLDIFLATGLALMGGILQLTNVLLAELNGVAFLGRNLLIAEGLSLAGFTTFRFFFLYHRTQHPGFYEFTPETKTTTVTEKVDRSMFRRSISGPISSAYIHSGSYKRWGFVGDLIKIAVFLAIIVIALLEGIWRLGFTTRFKAFVGIYTASNIIQIILLCFFAGKMMSNAWSVETSPRRANFYETIPYLFGIALGLATLAVSLVPGILLFGLTPLGRFLNMVETYVFLLAIVITDHKRPVQDALSFGIDTSQSLAELPRFVKTKEDVNNQKDETELPERIIVRRSSRVPSWLKRHGSESDLPLPPTLDPLGTEGGNAIPLSENAFDSHHDYLASYLHPPSILAGLDIKYGGIDSATFPSSIHQSEANYRQSSSAEVQDVTRRLHTRSFSGGQFDRRGARLSSPNLDHDFSFGVIMRRQQELEAIAEAEASQLGGEGGDLFNTPPPTFRSKAPDSPRKSLPSLPAAPPLPRHQPVPLGVGIDTSLYVTAPINSLKPFSTNLKSATSSSSALSNATRQSNVSGFSLSTFPNPPQPESQRELDRVQRPDSTLTDYSRSTANIVAGGAEFDMFYPESVKSHEDAENLTGSSHGVYVTSMIVGADRSPDLRQRSRHHSKDSLESLSPPFPNSPALSDELGEITQATITSRSGNVSRQGSHQLQVAGLGSVIPLPSTASSESSTGIARRLDPPLRSLNHISTASSDYTPSASLLSMRKGSNASLSRISSIGLAGGARGFDPNRPFERPRPAPLVIAPVGGLSRVSTRGKLVGVEGRTMLVQTPGVEA